MQSLTKATPKRFYCGEGMLPKGMLTRRRAMQDYPSVHNNDSVSQKTRCLHCASGRE